MRPTPLLRASGALRRDAGTAAGRTPARRIQFNALTVGLLGTLGVGIGLAIIGAVTQLATVLVYIGVAYFISLALEPIIRWTTGRGIPRWVASLGIVLAGLIAGFLVALAVVPVIVRQVTKLIEDAPAFAASLPEQPWVQWLTSTVGSYIDVDYLTSQLTTFLSDPQRWLSIGGGLLSIGSGLGEAVTAVIVVTVLSLYFTVTLPVVMEKVYQAVPRSRRDGFRSVTDEILQSVGKYVAGQLLLALINALVTFVIATAVGAPVPIVLALVAFVCALIPVVGPVIGTTIVVLSTLFVSPIGALIAGVLLLIYMQIEAYVLSPRVMSKAVAVPGALVIVAAIGGASLGGILGALVAIPVVAAGILIFERVIRPRQEAR
ncbi:AI-2E family transporter [Salinibacterium soli]|uniref:AI-2E family transporter n=1 Tax=Antiquaquibacter soli TaxID=3064523 RepID=A0ABT9BN36_9MICO|nr:AI-2E family transporter [Protaetiibacter sp. WY-16]MDO7882448.1 AI-2E family transporter [Protaetiibacter sp. WY-16]